MVLCARPTTRNIDQLKTLAPKRTAWFSFEHHPLRRQVLLGFKRVADGFITGRGVLGADSDLIGGAFFMFVIVNAVDDIAFHASQVVLGIRSAFRFVIAHIAYPFYRIF
jgi:hypothetical protein